jgi:hypothetical protein
MKQPKPVKAWGMVRDGRLLPTVYLNNRTAKFWHHWETDKVIRVEIRPVKTKGA